MTKSLQIYYTTVLGALGGLLGWWVVGSVQTGAWNGGLGGLAGGLLGGALYEWLTQLFRAQSDRAQVVVGGVGLMLLGACIGALIPLARQAFARGELRVLNGEQAGLVREVSDTATIGRYDGCDLYLPDAAVAWRHALIRRTSAGFALEVLPQSAACVTVGARAL